MKSTNVLRGALVCLFLPFLLGSMLAVVRVAVEPFNALYGPILYPIATGLLLATVPYYMALWQSWKLLGLIDRREVFSSSSASALGKISRYGTVVGLIFVVLLPFVFMLAQLDDAPGLVIVGMVPIFVAGVVALFSGLLESLLKEAVAIKSENDLKV